MGQIRPCVCLNSYNIKLPSCTLGQDLGLRQLKHMKQGKQNSLPLKKEPTANIQEGVTLKTPCLTITIL